jgi:hypothetical protein
LLAAPVRHRCSHGSLRSVFFPTYEHRFGLGDNNATGRLWPNCVEDVTRRPYFLPRIAQLACGDALRSANKRFTKSNTWVIGDGEHEPALGCDRAMVP